MKGEVLYYDDGTGLGAISGADGIRYSFSRSDLKQLVPVGRGTRVDFDFEGKQARDIYLDGPPESGSLMGARFQPYHGWVEPDLGLWGYFIRAFTTYYAKFSGRARRKEYWGFHLCLWALLILALVLIGLVWTFNRQTSSSPGASIFGAIIGLALVAFILALIIPSIALTVRRFHDIGWSGWIVLLLYVLSLIPYLGFVTGIVFLVVACIDSQAGENKYGPPPKRP